MKTAHMPLEDTEINLLNSLEKRAIRTFSLVARNRNNMECVLHVIDNEIDAIKGTCNGHPVSVQYTMEQIDYLEAVKAQVLARSNGAQNLPLSSPQRETILDQ